MSVRYKKKKLHRYLSKFRLNFNHGLFPNSFAAMIFFVETLVSGGQAIFYKKDELKYHGRQNRGARKITFIEVSSYIFLQDMKLIYK